MGYSNVGIFACICNTALPRQYLIDNRDQLGPIVRGLGTYCQFNLLQSHYVLVLIDCIS